MKYRLLTLYKYLPWLLLLLFIDSFAVLLLWLSDAKALAPLSIVILLTSVLLFLIIFFVLYHLESKRKQVFLAFLTDPDSCHEENLLKTINASDSDAICLLGNVLRQKELSCRKTESELSDYEEYIEIWAHEIKTPLSLLTMILDSRSEEISPSVHFKLDYVRNQMQEDINQILYYARLKSVQKDYLFESVNIRSCIEEVLDDYMPLLTERQFLIQNHVPSIPVFTDYRGIHFILSQIISNTVKYSMSDPELIISLEHSQTADILSIQDNGMGVRSCDLPYIFEKGFTGETSDNKKKATGMGLYLSKKMADDLNLHLEVQSEWKKGFKIFITFPIIKDKTK